ncbi:carbonic anhydrase [Balneolaceae bacterium YR4-1]|uniref:Carbonic anhydrase n=1 Tax=Halalkalibaculum roseum TaxID=2709311 RepID=A0A6M1SY22_9BACT|nr:carbonic anhydrase family protein [Halalkalibaculum roseum]NGP77962.1 carbonic anhydrase [Halalkalibaculum roseum]
MKVVNKISLWIYSALLFTFLIGCTSGNNSQTSSEETVPQVFTEEMQSETTPEEALEMLKTGNQRFVSGDLKYKDYRKQFEQTAKGQYPHSTVFACIDSRSSAEQFLDVGIGEIFKVRIAGNTVNEDVLGSMEFATQVAGSKVLAVIGHTSCGAVKGAIDDAELGHLTQLVDKIKPAMEQVPDSIQPRTSSNQEFVDMVTKNHIQNVLAEIQNRSEVISNQVESGSIKLVGGMYDLSTGEVTFFE